jgi:hypothetical protein
MLAAGLNGYGLGSGLAVACWRSRLLMACCRLSGCTAAPNKNLGSSGGQRPEPRGQAAPDFEKFSATQRVPPQVGSIRAAVRFTTCATCTPHPAYPCKACTGGIRRNAHLNAAPLTTKGPRLAPPGGDAMR